MPGLGSSGGICLGQLRASLLELCTTGFSCTYLARLGYRDVTVYERDEYVGGLSMSEIPAYRLPSDSVAWEVEQMKNLGVKIEYGKALGRDFTVESLKADGAKAVLVATGLPAPQAHPAFEGLGSSQGFWTSKDFLPQVAKASKPGMGCAMSVCWKSRGKRIIQRARLSTGCRKGELS